MGGGLGGAGRGRGGARPGIRRASSGPQREERGSSESSGGAGSQTGGGGPRGEEARLSRGEYATLAAISLTNANAAMDPLIRRHSGSLLGENFVGT